MISQSLQRSVPPIPALHVWSRGSSKRFMRPIKVMMHYIHCDFVPIVENFPLINWLIFMTRKIVHLNIWKIEVLWNQDFLANCTDRMPAYIYRLSLRWEYCRELGVQFNSMSILPPTFCSSGCLRWVPASSELWSMSPTQPCSRFPS